MPVPVTQIPEAEIFSRGVAKKVRDKLVALSKWEKILVIVFLVSLPMVNPWVRGDGVGYYAYLHALLIHHDLNFEPEWRAANPGFFSRRREKNGKIDPELYTSTGHLDNHFAVGPSILWAPFIVPLHAVLLGLKGMGANVKPDGFSRPYVLTMALATALYGFLGLVLCFRLARQYVEEKWAFLATLGIWFASSLPVYMYFNPSWSHAHSVFAVALFLSYWHRTRDERTTTQWVILGALSGLALDVYYPNIAFLLIPLLESLRRYWQRWREPGHNWQKMGVLLSMNMLYCAVTVAAFLPTLVTRRIIYGNPLQLGYGRLHLWRWTSPAFAEVLFSSDHGLLTWTPIVVVALVGLFLYALRDTELVVKLMVAFLAFYFLIASDPDWDGLSSFGNRYFISCTPVFIFGLSVFFSELAKRFRSGRAAIATAGGLVGILIVWNLAFMFQWGVHLVPARGPISWRQMVSNQFTVVPRQVGTQLRSYMGNRRELMQRIEQQDVEQLKQQEAQKEKK